MSASTVWKFDPTHSAVEFAVKHLMISTVKGRFTDFDIELEGDANDLTQASLSVSIDAASLDTHEADRDTHLRSADFLDVENHPKITFVSRSVTRVGADEYDIEGDLTIRGVTKTVTVRAKHDGHAKDPWGGERVAFSAQGTVSRKEFGLTWNVALETGGVLVGDEVKLAIEAQLVGESQQES